MLSSHASRRPSGVKSCAAPSPLATAIHRLPDWQRPNGARSRRAARIFQYVTEKAIRADKINGFLPARRRPFVDHSHVAGRAQRQASSGQAPSPELNGESKQSKYPCRENPDPLTQLRLRGLDLTRQVAPGALSPCLFQV